VHDGVSVGVLRERLCWRQSVMPTGKLLTLPMLRCLRRHGARRIDGPEVGKGGLHHERGRQIRIYLPVTHPDASTDDDIGLH
jgi:hypothetical protein